MWGSTCVLRSGMYGGEEQECALGHVGQPRSPPGVARLLHLDPVVGGEAPVLAVGVKVVRGGAGAAVHVELPWIQPGVHALL